MQISADCLIDGGIASVPRDHPPALTFYSARFRPPLETSTYARPFRRAAGGVESRRAGLADYRSGHRLETRATRAKLSRPPPVADFVGRRTRSRQSPGSACREEVIMPCHCQASRDRPRSRARQPLGAYHRFATTPRRRDDRVEVHQIRLQNRARIVIVLNEEYVNPGEVIVRHGHHPTDSSRGPLRMLDRRTADPPFTK